MDFKDLDKVMRAREFIGEAKLKDQSGHTLPATYILPKLPNQDPYLQYRMGLQLAAAGPGAYQQENESPWGENMAVVAYSTGEEEILKSALKATHQPAEMITTAKSEEPEGINKISPTAAKKKNKYGV